MKLIVQIPCLNEEKTLPLVVRSIPKKITGVDVIETMIIDDGSTDNTVDVARKLGVTYIVRLKQNRGLAHAFSKGIHQCLRHGADIIVNTDADNQYKQEQIPRLIAPILAGTHDIVIGDRMTDKITHFSGVKKFFQRFGSRVVNLAAGVNIPDAPSGFRAYSREAAMSLNIITNFSYAMETIIQAGKKRIPITHVAIPTNPKTRESRLFKSIGQHMRKSGIAILRSYAMYEPFKIFLLSGIVIILVGFIPYIRFLYLMVYFGEFIGGHIQSLLVGTVLIILGFMLGVIGILADLIAINRKLLEDILYRLKKQEFQK